MKNNKKVFLTFILMFVFTSLFSCKINPQNNINYEDPIFRIKPGVVKNVKAPSLVFNLDAAVVSWNPVDDAQGYIVKYQSAADYTIGNTPKSSEPLDNSFTSYTLTGLEEGERYVCWVESFKTLPNGEVLFSDASDRIEIATKPIYKISSSMIDSKCTLYFSTSERASVLHTGDIYTPQFVVYANVNDDNKKTIKDIFGIVDETQIPENQESSEEVEENLNFISKNNRLRKNIFLSSLSDGQDEYIEVLKTNSEKHDIKKEIPSNTKIHLYMDVNILNCEVGGEEESSEENNSQFHSIVNDPHYYPPEILNLETTNNKKDNIVLTWKTKPLNDGMEGEVEQRFKIERTLGDKKIEVFSYSEDVSLIAETLATKESEGVYRWVDQNEESKNNNLEPNKEYIYSITPYYYVKESADSNKYSIYSSRYTTQSNSSHILSRPISAEVSIDGTMNKETKEGFYTLTLSWKNPFEDSEITNKVVRVTINPDGSHTESGVSLTEEDQKNCSLTETITLSTDENKHLYKYYYMIYCINNDGDESEPFTSDDVKTEPSITQIEFIKDASGTSIEKNAKNATIEFKRISQSYLDEKYNNDLDIHLNVRNIEYTISRGTRKNLLEPLQSPELTGTESEENGYVSVKFKDENLEDNTTYYYQIVATYKDSYSSYDGISVILTVDNIKTLSKVSDISATQSESDEYITITWSSVENAHGYKVEYSDSGDNSSFKEVETSDGYKGEITFDNDNQTWTFKFTNDEIKENKGKTYYFRVSAKDKEENCTTPSDVVKGSLFGSYNFKVEATNLDYGDKIKLTWNKVEGATKYQIMVYAKDEEGKEHLVVESPINVSGTTEYMFDASKLDPDYVKKSTFVLSQPYYFVVTPITTGARGDGSEPVIGQWLPAPKNIKASKALYSQFVTVSFDKVDKADGYAIYRRLLGTNDWVSIKTLNGYNITEYDDINVIDNQEYEYTVTSFKNSPKIESPKQTYFEEDTESEYKENTNIGYKLSAPQILEIQELDIDADDYSDTSSNYPVIVKVQGVKGATSYTLRSTNGTNTYTIDQIKAKGNGQVDKVGYIETDSNGIISFYIPRPIVVSSPLFKVEIFATNDNQDEIESQKNSEVDYDEIVPSKLKYVEIVNLTNNAMMEILSEIDSKMSSDWWRGGNPNVFAGDNVWKHIDTDSGIKITYEYAIGGTADPTKWNDYFELVNYNYSSGLNILKINTKEKIVWCAKSGGAAGYLDDDTLDYIGKNNKGIIIVNLPLRYGTAEIQYKNVKADGSSGTYTITYNGKTFDVLSSDVHENVRVIF